MVRREKLLKEVKERYELRKVLPKKWKTGKFVWEEQYYYTERLKIPEEFRIGPKEENYIAITETGLERGGSWIMELCAQYLEPGEKSRDIYVREYYYRPRGFLRELDWFASDVLKCYSQSHNAKLDTTVDVYGIEIEPKGFAYVVFAIEANYLLSSGYEWAAMDIYLPRSREPFVIPFKYYLNGEYITTVECPDGGGIMIRADRLLKPIAHTRAI